MMFCKGEYGPQGGAQVTRSGCCCSITASISACPLELVKSTPLFPMSTSTGCRHVHPLWQATCVKCMDPANTSSSTGFSGSSVEVLRWRSNMPHLESWHHRLQDRRASADVQLWTMSSGDTEKADYTRKPRHPSATVGWWNLCLRHRGHPVLGRQAMGIPESRCPCQCLLGCSFGFSDLAHDFFVSSFHI